jgi:hypothetical protein
MRRLLAALLLAPAMAGAQTIGPINPPPIVQPPPLILPAPSGGATASGPSDAQRDRALRDGADRNRADKAKMLEQIDQSDRDRQQDQRRAAEPAPQR